MGQSKNVRVYDVQGSCMGEVCCVHISDTLVSSICAVQACRFVVSAVANGYVGVAYLVGHNAWGSLYMGQYAQMGHMGSFQSTG